ncbi:MAG: hypothetical protein GY759_08990 [Chloroflexi bacterium]|nr:hypothetical protein [Chloroflexota bacterium]
MRINLQLHEHVDGELFGISAEHELHLWVGDGVVFCRNDFSNIFGIQPDTKEVTLVIGLAGVPESPTCSGSYKVTWDTNWDQVLIRADLQESTWTGEFPVYDETRDTLLKYMGNRSSIFVCVTWEGK